MTTVSLSSIPFVFSEQGTLLRIPAVRKRRRGAGTEKPEWAT